MWHALWQTIGRPEIADDPRFTDRKERRQHIEELTRAHRGAGPAKRTKQEVMRIMGEAGVPCGAVLDSVELLNDPHLRERGMIVTVDHPVRGEFTMPGCPVRARRFAGGGKKRSITRPTQRRNLRPYAEFQ